MATKYYTGRAVAVAQVDTVEITAFDAATTYKLTVNGITVSAVGVTDVAATAAALVTAWNDSTHAYFTGVTAAQTGASPDDTISLTADTAGVPFTATSSVAGGTGTIGSVTSSTASSGPNHLDDATNYSDGSLPGNDDTVIFSGISTNVLFGLAQLTATGLIIKIEQSFTGKIGLPFDSFVTDGSDNSDSTAEEYRAQYMELDWAELEIGQNLGPSSPAGSTRLKLHNDRASASTTRIINTHTSGESSKPAVRMLLDDDDAEVFIQAAPGGFCLAADEPGETSNVKTISISDTTSASRVFIGSGVTFKASGGSYTQSGGDNTLESAGTIETVDVRGGTLTTFGDYLITTLNISGGTVNSNNASSASPPVSITTVNLNGGELNGQGFSESRTWSTVNLSDDGEFKADSWVTVTTLNEPTNRYTISMS